MSGRTLARRVLSAALTAALACTAGCGGKPHGNDCKKDGVCFPGPVPSLPGAVPAP